MKFSKIIPATRKAAVIVLLTAMAVSGILLLIPPSPALISETSSGLSAADYQSAKLEVLQAQATNNQYQPAIIVYSSSNKHGFTEQNKHAIESSVLNIALSLDGLGSPVVYKNGDTIAYATVQVDVSSHNYQKITRQVLSIRKQLKSLPAGITTQVTGGPAFTTDLAQVFKGADKKLLLVTVLVVAILLIITYRSPWLWIVPLAVVGLAEQLTTKVVALLAPHFGIVVDGSATGITSVIVFGAGTDYALLLIARYKDELHKQDNRFDAMRKAWVRTAEAILASGFTVILSLLTLLLASIESTRAIGFSAAIGIGIAVIFSLVVLPSALLIFGRGIFWPQVPKVDGNNQANKSIWGEIGLKVSRKPKKVLTIGVIGLLVLSLGVFGIRIGLSQNDQFRLKPEAVLGQQTLAKALPAGATAPVAALVSNQYVDQAKTQLMKVNHVVAADAAEPIGQSTIIRMTLNVAPDTSQSYQTIADIRQTVNKLDSKALVGGAIASGYDLKQAATRDQRLIIPLILVIVLVVLVILLRALVAPVILIVSVLLTFTASLGLSWFIFQYIYKIPALDTNVILLSFLFLVALGVDYNIFLATRAREETIISNTRDGMLSALKLTGGVITSAGILLASVFAVLGVLPLITLTQIGVIVGIGVLLDTLLVRTVLVPATAFILGHKFWYPSKKIVS